MGHGYQAVGWNPQKKVYDRAIALGVALFLAASVGVGLALNPHATIETHLIRGFGACAFFLLHVILVIGPLARLDRRFLPLLYNRRHLGVTMFLVGLAHGCFALFQFHANGNVDSLVSMLTSNERFGSLAHFPFQQLGLGALLVLFLMAATSHDFWLANLSPRLWKTLHMLVYGAWALAVAHVLLGELQAERNPLLALLVLGGAALVLALHLAAGWRERRVDRNAGAGCDWVDIGAPHEIPSKRAKVVTLGGERVAVFRHDGTVSAVSNLCAHQNGPLGEGRIQDGCITCPWHGYQYRPEDGCSPPPFTEKVPTYRVKVERGRVLVSARAEVPGTPLPPAAIEAAAAQGGEDGGEFYVGYLPQAPAGIARAVRTAALVLLGLALLVAAAASAAHRRLPAAAFEYATLRAFEGTLQDGLAPVLVVERPGAAQEEGSPYLLVGRNKFGAAELVRGLSGHRLRLEGRLIYRAGETAIEVEPGTVQDLGPQPAAPLPEEDLGIVTLRGEIVDPKCFLGVMNPGESKTHRDCAVRCIAGGIPPAFAVREGTGALRLYALVGPDGGSVVPACLGYVAEPLEITGRALRQGERLVLRADPREYRRLP
jgi:nitrite reductase/ring-hydroxylating ferredoxin subunit/DMSO/TMAO reductase YedYZ heme-binding membrane subunit